MKLRELPSFICNFNPDQPVGQSKQGHFITMIRFLKRLCHPRGVQSAQISFITIVRICEMSYWLCIFQWFSSLVLYVAFTYLGYMDLRQPMNGSNPTERYSKHSNETQTLVKSCHALIIVSRF